MARGDTGTRKVDPYQLLFRKPVFYLLGYAHERRALRVFRLSRIIGKVAYSTKAEHGFKGSPELSATGLLGAPVCECRYGGHERGGSCTG
jgi:predicted DNA-binding transcriptional regulator YafY